MGMKGDFIGFHLGQWNSEDLNIVRVSDGSYYSDNLSPTINDKTAEIPGGDGTYFFGSNFQQKDISINFAFDSVDEKDYRKIMQMCGCKDILELWFDETPYKAYWVKIAETPTLEYVCFYEKGKRVYKGEGSLSLVAYEPFAHSRFKLVNDDIKTTYSNWEEWIAASGLHQPTDTIQDKNFVEGSNKSINLSNCGDVDSNFRLILSFTPDTVGTAPGKIGAITATEIKVQCGGRILTLTAPIIAKQKTGKSEDYAIVINTKNNLIEGINSSGIKTGTIYNEYIKAGEFFKIPTGQSTFAITGITDIAKNDQENNTIPLNVILDYKYIYY